MRRVRLVSTLGLGKKDSLPPHYSPVHYRFEGVRTPNKVVLPLFGHLQMLQRHGVEVSNYLLGTRDVEEQWITSALLDQELKKAGLNDVRPMFCRVPGGGKPIDAAQFVARLLPLLQSEALHGESGPPDEIWVDITYGLRSQSVLATAAVEAAVDERIRSGSKLHIRLLYAAFDEKESDDGEDVAPIWELTRVVDQHAWASAIHAFIAFGRADAFASLTTATAKAIIQQNLLGLEERKQSTALRNLAQAARKLADGLATSRIVAILTQDALSFVTSVKDSREVLQAYAPGASKPLADLSAWATEFVASHPISFDGVRATLALARFAMATERFSECAVLLREASVSAFTLENCPIAEILQPGAGEGSGKSTFNKHREHWDQQAGARVNAHRAARAKGELGDHSAVIGYFSDLARVRNDVEHAGMQACPMAAHKVRDALKRLLERAPRALLGSMVPTTTLA